MPIYIHTDREETDFLRLAPKTRPLSSRSFPLSDSVGIDLTMFLGGRLGNQTPPPKFGAPVSPAPCRRNMARDAKDFPLRSQLSAIRRRILLLSQARKPIKIPVGSRRRDSFPGG